MFTLSSKATERMTKAIKQHEVKKQYLAEVEGDLIDDEGVLEHYLVKRDFHAQVYNHEHKGAKKCQLKFWVKERRKKQPFIEIELITGRYHQIRAQLSQYWTSNCWRSKISKCLAINWKRDSFTPHTHDIYPSHFERRDVYRFCCDWILNFSCVSVFYMKSAIVESVEDAVRAIQFLSEDVSLSFIEDAASLLSQALKSGHKLLIAGNGGVCVMRCILLKSLPVIIAKTACFWCDCFK